MLTIANSAADVMQSEFSQERISNNACVQEDCYGDQPSALPTDSPFTTLSQSCINHDQDLSWMDSVYAASDEHMVASQTLSAIMLETTQPLTWDEEITNSWTQQVEETSCMTSDQYLLD